LRAVERSFTLAPVEAADVAARERHPQHSLAVDVAAARAEARHRDVEDLRQLRVGIVAHDTAAGGAYPHSVPDRALGRIRHHGVGARAAGDAHVLAGVHWLIGLDIFVAFAVAIGVENERRPALRLGRIARLAARLQSRSA